MGIYLLLRSAENPFLCSLLELGVLATVVPIRKAESPLSGCSRAWCGGGRPL